MDIVVIVLSLLLLHYCHYRFVFCVCTEEAEPEEPEPASNTYGRRRSRAVLYQLSGHYKSDKPKTGKLKLNNVSFVLVESYNVNITSGHPVICDWAYPLSLLVFGTNECVCTFAIHLTLENITR